MKIRFLVLAIAVIINVKCQIVTTMMSPSYTANTLPTVAMDIGSPSFTLNVGIDSYLDISWVLTKECTSCGTYSPFSCGNSESCTASQQNLQIEFNGTQLEGTVITDTISISNATVNLPLVSIVNSNKKDVSLQGALGLSLKSFGTDNNLLSILKKQYSSMKGIMGITFNKIRKQKLLLVDKIQSCRRISNGPLKTLINGRWLSIK